MTAKIGEQMTGGRMKSYKVQTDGKQNIRRELEDRQQIKQLVDGATCPPALTLPDSTKTSPATGSSILGSQETNPIH